jgi:hypothetical protein
MIPKDESGPMDPLDRLSREETGGTSEVGRDRSITVRTPDPSEVHSMRMSMPAVLLRLEGAALLAGALLLYREHGASWLLFALLLLAPDLSMLGYLAGLRVGATVYNAAHTTVPAIALAAVGLLTDQDVATSVGLVWLAHIGLDRLVGYGLKYPEGFKETHLARV